MLLKGMGFLDAFSKLKGGLGLPATILILGQEHTINVYYIKGHSDYLT